ncbi:MAG: hypothetical protein ACLFRE_00925 [Desulfovermiculus sp.]
MQDAFGIYYYPFPGHKSIRMYVRENQDVIEFRLHSEKDPQLWAEHGWLTYEAVRRASEMYTRPDGKNPLHWYDFDVAVHVLKQARKQGSEGK